MNGGAIDSLMLAAKNFPLLSTEEEYSLCEAFAKSKKENPNSSVTVNLRNKIVSHNLRLVVNEAHKFPYTEDLVSEGLIGLIKGVDKFDVAMGNKLSTYVTYWIRACMLDYICKNHRMVKIGTTDAQRKLFFRLNKEKHELQSLGIDPTSDEIAERLNVNKEEVEEMEIRLGHEVSMDAPIDEDNSRHDQISSDGTSPDEAFMDAEREHKLTTTFGEFRKTLSPIEGAVFNMRMIEDLTLQDVGEKLSYSREYVRQVQNRVADKLRRYCKTNKVEI